MSEQQLQLEIKEITTEGTFEGLLSPYGNVDAGGDVVEPGAFTKTLKERGGKVPLLWQHDSKNPIGSIVLEDRTAGLYAKGQLLLSIPQAKAAYEAALKISPDHPAVLWNLVLTADQSGNPGEAERLCATLASKSPQSDAVLFRLGSLRFQRGDYSGSSEAFRNCLQKRPDWPAAQLNLGLALWKSGNRDEARQKLEGVNGPYGSEALHSLAMMATEREDYHQALGYYEKLAGAGERTPELFYKNENLSYSQGGGSYGVSLIGLQIALIYY